MEKIIYGGASNKRKHTSDITLMVGFKGPYGEPVSEAAMGDFVVEFYTDREPNERVVCSKAGDVYTGCELAADGQGTVAFAIPGRSFTTPGRLFMDVHTSSPSDLYPDGEENTQTGYDTGIIIIR